MKITNPNEYLKNMDIQRMKELLAKSERSEDKGETNIKYVEPAEAQPEPLSAQPSAAETRIQSPNSQSTPTQEIVGKIQRLGDFVDTDAVSKHISMQSMGVDVFFF